MKRVFEGNLHAEYENRSGFPYHFRDIWIAHTNLGKIVSDLLYEKTFNKVWSSEGPRVRITVEVLEPKGAGDE
jgi:hypothetical protein